MNTGEYRAEHIAGRQLSLEFHLSDIAHDWVGIADIIGNLHGNSAGNLIYDRRDFGCISLDKITGNLKIGSASAIINLNVINIANKLENKYFSFILFAVLKIISKLHSAHTTDCSEPRCRELGISHISLGRYGRSYRPR